MNNGTESQADKPDGELFDGYGLDAAYDEMFEAPLRPRAHYRALFHRLMSLTAEEFRLIKRSEEHTSELQSHSDLVCRLLLEKKKKTKKKENKTDNTTIAATTKTRSI